MPDMQMPFRNNLVTLSFDQGTLLLKTDDSHINDDCLHNNLWIWDSRVGSWRCEAIYYPQAAKMLSQRYGHIFKDNVPVSVRWPKVNIAQLRPEQQDAASVWKAAGCRGQIIMPTGTGKTEAAKYMTICHPYEICGLI